MAGMGGVNPVSDVGAGLQVGGDVGAMVAGFFAEKGNDAAEKVKAAIGKAQRDSAINKGMDTANGEMIQEGANATVPPNGSLYKMLAAAGAKGNTQAAELARAVQTGKLTSQQLAGVKDFLGQQKQALGAQAGGGGVNDDSVNMVLVQMAFQEYNNAINGLSSAAKSTGDSKKSITDRMQ